MLRAVTKIAVAGATGRVERHIVGALEVRGYTTLAGPTWQERAGYTTSVTTPNELEIRVERIFDAPRAHVFAVWTDPELIPEWWGDGVVVEEMDVRSGGSYRFRTAVGVADGQFREVDAPARLVLAFRNHLQTLESRIWAIG